MSTVCEGGLKIEPGAAGRAASACFARGLVKSAAWLAELQLVLDQREPETTEFRPLEHEQEAQTSLYLMARNLFECREFDRAAYLCRDATGPLCRFLYFYCKYSAVETHRLDNSTEANCSPDAFSEPEYRDLYSMLKSEYNEDRLDGYMLYLYGIILKKLQLDTIALKVLEKAVNTVPWLWGAWLELSSLVKNQEMIETLNLPQHCMYHFFLAHAYIEQKSPDTALTIYEMLKENGLDKFTYINSKIAVAYHDQRDVNNAINQFKMVQLVDPYRLENLDIYSHLLYVMEMRTELANLAHRVVEIDKYRVETCCIIGNYYSLRSEHQKAVVYFQRALKLNPNYLSAWILMGHEFIELQNTNAAILAYRHAIEVNRNDHRAWNGLGQAYEILGLNSYCLYYYSRAQQQCPNDSRMLVALGEAFEKLDKTTNALKCYRRAHSVGDIEGMAILKLAKLYDKLKMRDSAAAAYTTACSEMTCEDDKGIHEAYRYLANYHLEYERLDQAHNFAFKCLDFEETKEEGKSLLKIIAQRNRKRDLNAPIDECCRHMPNDSTSARSPSPQENIDLYTRFKL